MYNLTTIEVLVEGIKAVESLKPVLDNPKSVKDLIMGYKDAKETIAKAANLEKDLAAVARGEAANATESDRLERFASKCEDKKEAANAASKAASALSKEAAERLELATRLEDLNAGVLKSSETMKRKAEEIRKVANAKMKDALKLKETYERKLTLLTELEK